MDLKIVKLLYNRKFMADNYVNLLITIKVFKYVWFTQDNF